MRLLYLSRKDVESLNMPMTEVVQAVEEVFIEKGHGRVEMPPKPGIHPLPDAFIHAMPAYVPKFGAAGIKWVSGFPQNMPKKLPYITGLLILNDPATGFPISVMDCTWITAQRTGAASAVAAKYLARPDSRCVAILGCGVQGRSNWEALKTVLPKLDRVQAYDINPAIAKSFCDTVSKHWPVEAVVAQDARAACHGADIVVTAGPILKQPTPVVEPAWLKEGVFLSPVDFDSYVTAEVLNTAAKLYTDDLAQQRHYKEIGYFQKVREPDGDLGEVVTGKKPGRADNRETTVALNLGIALEDMATAIRIYHAAQRAGIGQQLEL